MLEDSPSPLLATPSLKEKGNIPEKVRDLEEP